MMSDILERIFGNVSLGPSDQDGDGDGDGDGDTVVTDRLASPPVVETAKREETAQPPMYAVLLHNDDSTHFNFVVEVLHEVFRLQDTHALQTMITAHNTGQAVVAIYSKEVAESKLEQAKVKIERDGQGQNGRNSAAPCELRFSMEPQS